MKNFFLLFALLTAPAAWAKVNVVATLPVFASLATEIGGDRVEITSIARSNQDPHFLDAKPTFVVALSKADILIRGGLGLETGWLPPILMQARNPKIQTGASGDVDTSQGLRILEVLSKADRSMGDVHPEGNPHTWLDPNNAKIMAANIYKHLAAVDTEGSPYYKSRMQTFLDKLNEKVGGWNKSIQGLRGKKVMTYHKSFSYFADWAGLDITATVEPLPGIPPSSKDVETLLKKISAEGIKAILMEDYYPEKVPKYLSDKSGIPLLILPDTTGNAGVATYDQLIDKLLGELSGI